MEVALLALERAITPQASILIIVVVLVIFARLQQEKINKLTDFIEERNQNIEEKIEGIQQQLKDFITKEEHYRDVSGWRGELQKLDAKLDRFIEKFIETRGHT
jgi:F0F1-type ATP synthase membrane subunit b/b'